MALRWVGEERRGEGDSVVIYLWSVRQAYEVCMAIEYLVID